MGSPFAFVEDDTRDAAFAERREAFIVDQLAASLVRLVPGAVVEDLECMSASCLVTLQLPADARSTSVAQWLPWGDAQELRKAWSDEKGDHYELAAFYTPQSLDHDRFEAAASDWLRRTEPEIAEMLRQDVDTIQTW